MSVWGDAAGVRGGCGGDGDDARGGDQPGCAGALSQASDGVVFYSGGGRAYGTGRGAGGGEAEYGDTDQAGVPAPGSGGAEGDCGGDSGVQSGG